MVKQSGRVVVKIDGPKNEGFYFGPLGRRIRGRFDPRRLPEPGRLAQRFPQGVVGQYLELDCQTRTGAVVEPLHFPEHVTVGEEIRKTAKLPAAREEFRDVNTDEWQHYLKCQVQAGLARLVEGEFGAIDASKVAKTFITVSPPSAVDQLTAAIRDQTAVLTKLLQQRA